MSRMSFYSLTFRFSMVPLPPYFKAVQTNCFSMNVSVGLPSFIHCSPRMFLNFTSYVFQSTEQLRSSTQLLSALLNMYPDVPPTAQKLSIIKFSVKVRAFVSGQQYSSHSNRQTGQSMVAIPTLNLLFGCQPRKLLLLSCWQTDTSLPFIDGSFKKSEIKTSLFFMRPFSQQIFLLKQICSFIKKIYGYLIEIQSYRER